MAQEAWKNIDDLARAIKDAVRSVLAGKYTVSEFSAVRYDWNKEVRITLTFKEID